MRVIILAQGQQSRLHGVISYPKQFITVNGEPIIERTLRMLWHEHENELDGKVAVVGPHDFKVLEQAFNVELVTLEDPGHCVLRGLYQTTHLWGEACVILLGDVVYSWEALSRAMSGLRPLYFTGTSDVSPSQGELFSLTMADALSQEAVVEAIEHAPCLKMSTERYQAGHLRNILWMFTGMTFAHRNTHTTLKHPALEIITDYTTDIDTREDFEHLHEIEAFARADRSTRTS